MTEQQWIKPPVEIRYAEELKALKENDTGPRPLNWQLSPKAVRTFILGSSKEIPYSGGACRIRKKYFGNDALVERSIVTLAGNRGLMLVGERLIASGINSPLRSRYSTLIFLQALPRPLPALPNWLNAQVSQTPPGSP